MTTDAGRVQFSPHVYSNGRIHLAASWTPVQTIGSLLASMSSLLRADVYSVGHLSEETYREAISRHNAYLQHETLRVAVCDAVEACLQGTYGCPRGLAELVVVQKFHRWRRVIQTIDEALIGEEDLDGEHVLDEVKTLKAIGEVKILKAVEEVRAVEALEAVEALGAVEVLEAVEALGAVEVLEAVEALGVVQVLEAVEALGAVQVLEAVEALGAVEVLEEVEALGAVEVLEEVEALGAVEVLEAVEALGAVEVLEAVEALGAVEVLEAVEALGAVEVLEAVEALGAVKGASSGGSPLGSIGAWSGGNPFTKGTASGGSPGGSGGAWSGGSPGGSGGAWSGDSPGGSGRNVAQERGSGTSKPPQKQGAQYMLEQSPLQSSSSSGNISLRTNYFRIQRLSGVVYHYDVEIKTVNKTDTSRDTKPRGFSTRVKRRVVEALQQSKAFKKYVLAFDGTKNLYTSKPLPSKEVEHCVAIDEKSNQDFFITLKLASTLDMEELKSPFDPDVHQKHIQALDILIRHAASQTHEAVGRYFFKLPHNPPDKLAEVYHGFYTTFRPCKSEPMLNIDFAAMSFCHSMTLLKFAEKVKKERGASSLPELLSKELKGLQIYTTYLGYKRFYRVERVSEKSAKDQDITVEEKK
ncbi:hypothetical protein MRX96_043533 [Rhipicephalus microplus]